MSYGQNLLLYLSKFFDNNYKGVCVDVGSYDGIDCSTTYNFENKGWNSLYIESSPEIFAICNTIRKYTINCCLSNYDKNNIDYNMVSLKDNNIVSLKDNKIVQVKSLNTIFQEERISKNIDFISIISAHAEIDVLKGINFNNYNVKFLIIENNFNQNTIEDYLKTQNFKKINRLSLNDFYVNNNYLNILIHDYFKITCANYYNVPDEKLGNVTDIVNILLQRYMTYYTNDIIVSNNIFNDTLIFVEKKLFITINNIKTNKEFKFIFGEGTILDFHFIFEFLIETL